mmetsp:Transcript_50894/g.55110  ORF Transcript_50894/g.55110 Transcript_50894/m.55110 type:complete len:106 (-) Transcript_50894:119-436(-)
MSSYGTMEEVMPNASRRHLLGASKSSRAPLMNFPSKQQSQSAVLKTIISKRRLMTPSYNNNNIDVQSKSFVFTMLVSACYVFINSPTEFFCLRIRHLILFFLFPV